MRTFGFRYLLGRSVCDEFTAACAAFRTHVDDVIRANENIEIVLDDDNRIAVLDKLLENFDKLRHVVVVQDQRSARRASTSFS